MKQKNGNKMDKINTNTYLLWDTMRGAVVEWLEQLDYGTESRRKVVSSRLGFTMLRLENSLC